MRLRLVQPKLSTRQTAVIAVVAIFLTAAVSALVFGPARGARDDIGAVRHDLHHARHDIHRTLRVSRTTLGRLTVQLKTTQQSLQIQQQGLAVARDAQQVAHTGLRATETIRRQTVDTLSTLRRVVKALGPLSQLHGDINTVVHGVQAGVTLARSTLAIAQQTLSTGKAALTVATTTLHTLKLSYGVQLQLLDVARQTLQQTVEINRKIPFPPVFPTARSGH